MFQNKENTIRIFVPIYERTLLEQRCQSVQYKVRGQKYTNVRWCLHDTGMNFIPERLAWFVSRLHGRSHSGMKML